MVFEFWFRRFVAWEFLYASRVSVLISCGYGLSRTAATKLLLITCFVKGVGLLNGLGRLIVLDGLFCRVSEEGVDGYRDAPQLPVRIYSVGYTTIAE